MTSPAGEGSGEPHLSPTEDGVLLSWLQDLGESHTYRLLVASFQRGGWSEPVPVIEGDRLFVNWADLPSVETVGDRLLAHWLQRGALGGYDYGVRIVTSPDGGRTWSEPWTPHGDGTPTEHGFVTIFPAGDDGRAGLVWLDGRRFAEGPGGEPATDEMTLRYRELDGEGVPGPEVVLDELVCDCCQTDVAVAGDGPVLVYRNRTRAEVRDVYVMRRVDGSWSKARPVHEDGWVTPACPVNGPAVAARGDLVVVAWFTGAGDVPRVRVAFSSDGGASFGEPHTVDDGDPAGRVDVVLLEDGSAVVSWLERTDGQGAELRVKRVRGNGTATTASVVAGASAARASGFPRMAPLSGGDLLFAWTDTEGGGSRIRLARATVAAW